MNLTKSYFIKIFMCQFNFFHFQDSKKDENNDDSIL